MRRVMRFEMHLFAVMLLGSYVVVTTGNPPCDPTTQYEKSGECCKMCGPGTAMTQSSTCSTPQCEECKENEYQGGYTKEAKCETQPYCDPNKNFEPYVDHSKKEKSICNCKLGFHCSNSDCLSCVAHTACEPGSEARPKGDHSSDTVCQQCQEGTFSNITSWKSECMKWTECETGYYIYEKGTAKSDNVCAKKPRTHIYLWIVSPLLVVIVIVAVVVYRRRRHVKNKMKPLFCDDSHEEKEPGNVVLIAIDQNPAGDIVIPKQETTHEEGSSLVPEENLDEESQEFGNLTDNGNYVTQERGKSEIISRQESQTCTVISST